MKSMCSTSNSLSSGGAAIHGIVKGEPIMESRNFEFLRHDFRELAELAAFAESYIYNDPVSALVKLRTYAEFLVKAVFAHYRLELNYQSTLNDLLRDASFQSITPPVIQDKLHLLRIKGNHAAHGTLFKETENLVSDFLKEAHDLGRWLVLTVGSRPASQIPRWQPIPRQSETEEGLQQKTKAALAKLAEQEALMAKLLEDLETARAQAESAKKSETEIAEILKHAQQAANALDFSEEETRFKLIDEMLAAAGWEVGSRGVSTAQVGQEIEVLHQPTTTGKGFVDYVLWALNGKPLAVVEAKKTAEDAQKGKMQAKYYADGMEKMHGQRPLIFYTNGYDLYFWDDAKKEAPRKIFGFYSRDSLEYALFQTQQRESVLAALNPKSSITDRLYQIEAIKRICENFDKRRRQALVIQATGTGKTRVAIAFAELMIRAKWAKRILFLCDRRELRKQAADAFDEFLPSEPRVLVTRSTSGDRTKRIYLSTYPAMMKCYQNFDPGFFDLIIADESHRSIYNRYRDIFRWFDSYQAGLTATPVKFIHRNTYSLFGCENEDPTSNFTYEEAIAHDPPYLCPFTVTKHTTKFLREGIKYKNLTKEQQEQLDEQVEDSESVDYEKEHVSRQVFNRDTDKAIIRNLMENSIRNADGTRLGKSIIFARNHAHAKQLVEVFDELYPQYGGDFCLRIDNYEPRAEQLIDDFKSTDGSKNLTIAVSVDMLDTGIDIPSIVNLVFAKPVKSYSKFWQMIGRGTRLCPNLFGPGQDKTEFRIFDHWGNFEYFDELQKEAEPSRSKSLPELLFESRIALGEAALHAQDLSALKLATQLLASDIAALPENCLSVREKWKDIRGMQKDGVLEGFAAATVATLRTTIAPLMQWRDCRGKEAALRFDLLITRLIVARLTGSSEAETLRDEVINQLSDLPINLKPVQEKLPIIQKAKQLAFYQNASVADLENLRQELRGIMRYRKNSGAGRTLPVFLNVAEDPDEYHVSSHKVKLAGMDLAAYRSRVEAVLKRLFEQSAVLKKIRVGEPVAESDLEELVSDVLLQDPDLHLEDLLDHYPNKSKSLALAIRRIVGMDAAKVDEHLKAFVQQYPSLNANQIRFLELLKAHISTYGSIELERLWETPFTSIHAEGIDGVFSDSNQIDELLDLLQSLNESAA
jgi:type I restriction enzyme, R subunit